MVTNVELAGKWHSRQRDQLGQRLGGRNWQILLAAVFYEHRAMESSLEGAMESSLEERDRILGPLGQFICRWPLPAGSPMD